MLRFALLLLVFTTSLQAALAAPPTAAEQRQFRGLLRAADAVFLLEGDAAIARKRCEDARSYAARFDRSEFWSGVVEYCFAQVGQYQKNKSAACASYARAIALLAKAPAAATLDEYSMGARTSGEFRKEAEKARRKLGC